MVIYLKRKINMNFIWFSIIFMTISMFSIYSSLTYTSDSLGNLALKQSLWYLVGFIIICFIIKLKNDFFYKNAWFLYCIGICSLILLLLFGTPINNSKCWFIIPGIGSIQPSEFMKLFIVLVLGRLIYEYKEKTSNYNLYDEFLLIIKCFFVIFIPSFLTFLQPDTGAVIIYIIIFAFMMFFSGISFRWFLFALFILLMILAICGGIFIFNEQLFLDIFGTSIYYRIERFLMWQDGVGLQLENALAAIGSSGLFGHGFNKTPIYFPESSTDFIFAVFASNFGFAGVILLISVISFFDIYIISLMKKKKNGISELILSGILGMLLFQQIQNIGMTLGLFPITGITLPFISYGGSSLISYMVIIGILININSEKKFIYRRK